MFLVNENYDHDLLFCSKYLRNKLKQSYVAYRIYNYSNVLFPLNQLKQINAQKNVKRIIYDYEQCPYYHSLHEFTSMTQLVLGHKFNQPYNEKMLPHSLVCIILGDSFNQRMDNVVLAIFLQRFKFGTYYQQRLDEVNFLIL